MTVNKTGGSIETKRSFHNYRFMWSEGADDITAAAARGNSGVFLASTGPGDADMSCRCWIRMRQDVCEWNGGELYKQAIPLANPTRKPGEWNVYDIAWTAPVFER